MILYFFLLEGKPHWLKQNYLNTVSHFGQLNYLSKLAHHAGLYGGKTVNLGNKDSIQPSLYILTLIVLAIYVVNYLNFRCTEYSL
jgi:hypothetical protein